MLLFYFRSIHRFISFHRLEENSEFARQSEGFSFSHSRKVVYRNTRSSALLNPIDHDDQRISTD